MEVIEFVEDQNDRDSAQSLVFEQILGGWVVTGQVNDHWSQYIPNCKAFVVNHFSDVNAEQSLKLMINIRQTGSCGNEMNRWNFSDEQ